ncbi:uncharacterized protein LOC110039604 isoform X2 [Phalaenopsis equestris]|uniref:uncharacterized protein LOC110039604 isoform X2 n=1 Tax=Phalaenopsis equestris TaxID=78828 RepID=UPI0009E46408|nr:uncharacterized protein LOC110039604 isoform X2 [Phalaenopsis equestris]
MSFAVSSKGLIQAIVRDYPDYGGSLSMLQSPISSSLSFSNLKSLVSLQISFRLIKRGVCACSSDNGFNGNSAPIGEPSSSKEASFNMNFPRRNMIVQFTCNSCGERTQRRINRAAYERGTVFIQISPVCRMPAES